MAEKLKLFILSALLLLHASVALGQTIESVGYDGLFFMGFNMKNPVFLGPKGNLVRKAINYCIDREKICKRIFGEQIVPSQVIPYKMPGYDDSIKGYEFSKQTAINTLKKAGNPIFKEMLLLHTDGEKTIETAKEIQKNLSAIGIKVKLKEIEYEKDDSWETELSKGYADLFLMGYKTPPQPFEKNDPISRSEKFLEYLFYSSGEANMFFLKNEKIDTLINSLKNISDADNPVKIKLLQKINKILYDDPVTVNLFYIKELE